MKSIFYNILSLINIALGFVFILFISKYFGLSNESDKYFISHTILNFLVIAVQTTWDAFIPYYVKNLTKNSSKSTAIYRRLLKLNIGLSIPIVAIYYMTVLNGFHFGLQEHVIQFLNFYILYFPIRAIIIFNNFTLNLNKYYSTQFIVEIFINAINILVMVMFKQIEFLAYSVLFSGVVIIIIQFSLLRKNHSKYKYALSDVYLKGIVKKSFILKSGSILYNLKDIIIVQFFESRPGLYSIYAFSLKFATALNLIANAPIMNIFITKVNNLVSEKSERKKYFSLYKSVLSQTLTLYIIGFLATYFLLPYLLKLDMIDVDINNIAVVKRYFLLLSLFYLVVIMFSPFNIFNCISRF